MQSVDRANGAPVPTNCREKMRQRASAELRLLDHLVAAGELARRHGISERFRRLYGTCPACTWLVPGPEDPAAKSGRHGCPSRPA